MKGILIMKKKSELTICRGMDFANKIVPQISNYHQAEPTLKWRSFIKDYECGINCPT